MRYIQSTLLSDEKVIHSARPHWIIFSTAAIYLIISAILLIFGPDLLLSGITLFSWQLYQLLALVVFIVALYFGLGAFITYSTSEYGITNKRILIKVGFIRRISVELFLDKIEAIQISQSISGRIWNYGTIVIIGTGGSRDPFCFVPSPLKFRKVAQQQIDLVKKS